MRFVILFVLLFLLVGCGNDVAVEVEETDCPFGNVDCPYPGQCGRYVDEDGNNICDNSE